MTKKEELDYSAYWDLFKVWSDLFWIVPAIIIGAGYAIRAAFEAFLSRTQEVYGKFTERPERKEAGKWKINQR